MYIVIDWELQREIWKQGFSSVKEISSSSWKSSTEGALIVS